MAWRLSIRDVASTSGGDFGRDFRLLSSVCCGVPRSDGVGLRVVTFELDVPAGGTGRFLLSIEFGVVEIVDMAGEYEPGSGVVGGLSKVVVA